MYNYSSKLIHGPNIPGFCAILFLTALDFTSTTVTSKTRHCSLWLCPFILSGVISPLLSNSIVGTYRPGESIFQCHVFLAFQTVHGVLKARMLKWFAIPFTSESCFVRTLHHNPSVLDGLTQQTRLWSMWSVWLVFCDCGFHSVCPLMNRIRCLW